MSARQRPKKKTWQGLGAGRVVPLVMPLVCSWCACAVVCLWCAWTVVCLLCTWDAGVPVVYLGCGPRS